MESGIICAVFIADSGRPAEQSKQPAYEREIMAGKEKKKRAQIKELIENNQWDQVQHERDLIKYKRIKKLEGRSNIDVVLGVLLLVGTYNIFIDIAKVIGSNAKKAAADNAVSMHALLNGVNTMSLAGIVVAAAVGLFFISLATRKNEKINKISETRFIWMPDEKEVAYIDKRFDNDFVKSILSDISPEKTHSVEVGLDDVTINNSAGPLVHNYNKCGFNQLTNYDTKQLAYYLASRSFPEGFAIYQARTSLAGADRIVAGITEVGGERPPEEDETVRTGRMLSGLFEQIKKIFRIRRMKNPFESFSQRTSSIGFDDGQIVMNKGFKPDNKEYANL